MLDQADLSLLAESLSGFSADAARSLFAHGDASPDGDLDQITDLVARATALDLVVDPRPGSDRHDLGVWGRHVHDHGVRMSLLVLAHLAEACAGLAAGVHAQGIGCLALDGWTVDDPEASPAAGASVAAAFVPSYGVLLDPRAGGDGMVLRGGNGGARLTGSSPFVWTGGTPDWLAVVARTEVGDGATTDPPWSIVALPSTTDGLEVEPLGVGVGLRAMRPVHLRARALTVPDRAIVVAGDRATHLVPRIVACDWLGLAAIALGSARRALDEARAYALQRRQGGQVIAGHAAVRLLLAEAEDALAVMQALMESRADEPLGSIDDGDLLRWAISSRLAIATHAQRAVTSCVQVLGGYGYMDDYGLSKRLRDLAGLRARHGSREQLLLLLESLHVDGGS